jgi:nitrogen-specific signal transduction histidine kinase
LIGGRGPVILFVRDVEPGIELQRNWAWERVLINLFSNAVRAMPAGGTIHISARRMGLSVGNPAENGAIEIVVRDDGRGIAPEILPVIFEPHVSTIAWTAAGRRSRLRFRVWRSMTNCPPNLR